MRPGRQSPPKYQCGNCPARNNRVRLCTFTLRGEVVRRMFLCEECARIAARMVKESHDAVESIIFDARKVVV